MNLRGRKTPYVIVDAKFNKVCECGANSLNVNVYVILPCALYRLHTQSADVTKAHSHTTYSSVGVVWLVLLVLFATSELLYIKLHRA